LVGECGLLILKLKKPAKASEELVIDAAKNVELQKYNNSKTITTDQLKTARLSESDFGRVVIL